MIAQYRGIYTDGLPLPDEALAAFFDAWTPAPARIETVSLAAAFDRVLARDVHSPLDIPEYPRSAMDGFAVRAEEVRTAGRDAPVLLELAGEVRPGSRPVLPERSVMRIATGAPLPVGADCVVRSEDAFVHTHAVAVARPIASGTDVVAAGEDIAAGNVVASAGTVINAALVGVFAALGLERIAVYSRPSIALISTGDEVVPIAASPRLGEVRDSNGATLTALLRSFGVETVSTVHVRDDLDALERAFAQTSEAYDAVVLSGGSSVGVRDLTTAALAKHEPGVIVHGVRMKPGRPVLLAASGSRPIIGLPGNPTAAMLALMIVGAPIIAKLCARPMVVPSNLGIAMEWLVGRPGWSCYVPVRTGHDGGVTPVEHMCSTFLSSLVEADGYVHIDAERARISPGELVRVYRLP
jgi:molybdopterin molybdotransferase